MKNLNDRQNDSVTHAFCLFFFDTKSALFILVKHLWIWCVGLAPLCQTPSEKCNFILLVFSLTNCKKKRNVIFSLLKEGFDMNFFFEISLWKTASNLKKFVLHNDSVFLLKSPSSILYSMKFLLHFFQKIKENESIFSRVYG